MFWLFVIIFAGFAYGMYRVFQSVAAETKRQAEGIDTDPTIEDRLKIYLGEAVAPRPSPPSFQEESQEENQGQDRFGFNNRFDEDEEEDDNEFDFDFDDNEVNDFDFGRTREKEEEQEESSFQSLFEERQKPQQPASARMMTFNEKRASIQAEKDARSAKNKAAKQKKRDAKMALDKLSSRGKFKFSAKEAVIYNVIMDNKYQNINYE